jgi:mannose-6-phosphate isomerase-like protein (cupin superfamily)
MPRFDRENLSALTLAPTRAHHGVGRIHFARIADAEAFESAVNFVDYAELPPGTSIGRHRHGLDEEELYLVLSGEGLLWRDGQTTRVGAGDLVRNVPGGAHGLENPGPETLRLFVIELQVVHVAQPR